MTNCWDIKLSLKTPTVCVAEICLSSRWADASELQGESPWPGAQQRGHRWLFGEVSTASTNKTCIFNSSFGTSLVQNHMCCFKDYHVQLQTWISCNVWNKFLFEQICKGLITRGGFFMPRHLFLGKYFASSKTTSNHVFLIFNRFNPTQCWCLSFKGKHELDVNSSQWDLSVGSTTYPFMYHTGCIM